MSPRSTRGSGRSASRHDPGLTRYVAGRLAVALGLLILLSIVVYGGVAALPGDPVTARLGGTATPEQIAEGQARLGLDRPLPERYGDWVTDLLTGDLGTSATGTPVTEVLGRRMASTAELVLLTVFVLIPASLALGVALGRRTGRRSESAGTMLLLLLGAVPEFVLAGMLTLLLAIWLRWVPAVAAVPAGANPLAHPSALVLPVLTLLLVGLAYATRVIRAATASAERAPHVEFMRLNGFPERVIVRQAVIPAVLPAALQVWLIGGAALLGGTVLVEQVTAYPGVGPVLVDAVQNGDLPVVQAIAMLFGGATLIAMLIADVLGTILDPRRERRVR